ncbi:glyoxalase family protein [Staphylococcus aureus]|nr:glyoxalase family protein [Staphylococcus aureus]CAC8083051.1 glyoxalase family protein [Staphylococcus aureus]
MNIVGHHHISMYTKDAKRNKDFTQMSLDYD